MHLFAQTAYRVLAVWPGDTPADAVSATPLDIQPGSSSVSLRLRLTQPGNPFLEEHEPGIGSPQ